MGRGHPNFANLVQHANSIAEAKKPRFFPLQRRTLPNRHLADSRTTSNQNQQELIMNKSIVLAFTFLTCTAWMAAQSTSPSSGSTGSTSSSAGQSSGQMGQSGRTGSEIGQDPSASQSGQMSGSNHTTLKGCLSSSGGGYMLTDAAGTQYQLTGDTSKLSAHVNNEVELKGSAAGMSGSSSSAGSQTAAGTAGEGSAQTFNVTKVKKLASNCSTSK
jgi:Protein of unknown function (DUF5818)